jgi:hypothetical protein
MSGTADLPPIVTRVYAAVIDGKNPAAWQPYGGPQLSRIIAAVRTYEALSPDQSLGPACMDFLLDDVEAIKSGDNTSIVAVLVDANDFTGQPGCAHFTHQMLRLRKLCFTLAQQKVAHWRTLGFRIWLVGNPTKLLKAGITWNIKHEAKACLEVTAPGTPVDVVVQVIPSEDVIAFVAQDTAKEAAERRPFLVFQAKG